MVSFDKASSQGIVNHFAQLFLNPETDFPSVYVLWPTESLPNLRNVALERTKSSAMLCDNINIGIVYRY